MANKILIVEDDPDIVEIISYNLKKELYQVSCAMNGLDAIDMAIEIIPDLILLDIMLPDLDGIEVCKKLRKNKELDNTLIAFLTARNEEYQQIAGFEIGADDYIAKPIKPQVLISRIKGLLRRKQDNNIQSIIRYEDILLSKETYSITKGDDTFYLPRKEFELLFLLLTKPDKVFTRQEILHTVWGSDIIVGDRTIDVHIRKIREKIGDDKIKTIKGIGYKFANDNP